MVPIEKEDDIPLSERIIQFNIPHTNSPDDLQNYAEIYENLVTKMPLTDEEILNAMTKGKVEKKEHEDEE